MKRRTIFKSIHHTKSTAPSGWYISEILSTDIKKTKSGRQYLDVYHKLEPAVQGIYRVRGLLDSSYNLQYYYFHEKIPMNTVFFNYFLDDISDTLEKKEVYAS